MTSLLDLDGSIFGELDVPLGTGEELVEGYELRLVEIAADNSKLCTLSSIGPPFLPNVKTKLRLAYVRAVSRPVAHVTSLGSGSSSDRGRTPRCHAECA